MLYAKKAITLEKQADQLIGRGLIADRDELIARLKAVNYYRLSGYLHPFRLRDAHGARIQFANGLDRAVLKLAAADFGFPDEQLRSWTKAIFTLRNACAHHSRIWNRVFGVKPSVPGKNKNPQWHISPGFANDRAGILLTVCHHWLGKVTPTTRWKARLFALFDEYPEIPLAEMGLPPDWRTHPLWR